MNRLNLNLEKLLSGTQIKSLRETRHALNRKSFTKFNYLFIFKIFFSRKLKKFIKQEISSSQYWHNEFYYKKRNGRQILNGSNVKKEDFWVTVKNALDKPLVMLDLGAGVRPFTLLSPEIHIIVEMFEPYLRIMQSKPYHNTVLIQDDVVKFCKQQNSNSIDTVIINDVIEHLSREDGEILIQELMRITSNQILVFTPNGFMEMHEQECTHGWQILGNSAQNHISGWEPGDFNNWDVITCDDYHKEIGYDGGAFAAIYKKNSFHQDFVKPKVLVVISQELVDSSNTELFNSLIKRLNEYKDNLSITYILHYSLSPYSHKLNHEVTYPEDYFRVYYTSGNPIDKKFIKYKRELNTEWLNEHQSLLIYIFKDDYFSSIDSSIVASKKIYVSTIEELNRIDLSKITTTNI
jgi:hypothetical protein